MAMMVMRWFCGATCGPSCNKAGYFFKTSGPYNIRKPYVGSLSCRTHSESVVTRQLKFPT